MKTMKGIARVIFYVLVLLVYLGRAAHWGFSHDENQFISVGQFLVNDGLFPYVNFPYTHMPYGALFYGFTAMLSNYDYLAGRVLNALAWMGCSLVLAYIFKLFREPADSWGLLVWEFVVGFIFLNHPSLTLIAGEALNHSLSSFFGLLALMFFIRFTQRRTGSNSPAFWSGVCAGIAALTRFNYASLVVVLIALFIMIRWMVDPPLVFRSFLSFISGVVVAALPASVLIILAPNGFYYGNLVYTRLNTAYYQQLLFKSNMHLGEKITGFLTNVLHTPLDLILYGLLLFVGLASFILWLSNRSVKALDQLAVAAFAFTLLLTAFTPTPTQQQYYFAPVPFLMIILAMCGLAVYQRSKWIFYIAVVGSLVALNPGLKPANPLSDAGYLSDPSQWTPLQVHAVAQQIKRLVPEGRILTLIPMIPLEAGDDAYSFAATGPFSWRTSLLLTPQRRTQYGVISPDELPALLDRDPPSAILTGFESPYDGFNRSDPGGLETPLIDYAKKNGFQPVSLSASFVGRPITLWIKPP